MHSPKTSRREVVITGMGATSAFGVGVDPFWSALVEGRSGIRRIERFDPSNFPCPYAGELPPDEFSIRDYVPKSYRKATKVMASDIELAVAAAANAVADAGLVTKATDADAEPTIAPDRMGCHIGAGLIAADIEELTAALVTSRRDDGSFDIGEWGRNGMNNLTPLWLLKYLPNMLACHVTIIHDCQGPSNTITCSESSSILSMGESMRAIERGAADACLSGGAEDKVNPMGLLRQTFAQRLASPGDVDPATIVRPFAPDASGTVLGQGGGIVVLEAAERAAARGATAVASVVGFASTQSFCTDTVGLAVRDASGITDAVAGALDDAGLGPESIDAVVPFGSGIPAVDAAEAEAFRTVLGDRAASVPMVTVVPNVGSCGAGAGALAVIAGARSLATQTLPARLNTTGASGLDADATGSRSAELDTVLVVSTSIGGQNAAIVLRKASA